MAEPIALTLKSAAALTGVSVSYLRRQGAAGKWPLLRPSRRKVLILRSDLDAFLGRAKS